MTATLVVHIGGGPAPMSAVEWSQIFANWGTFAASIAGFVTLLIISYRTLNAQWTENFRKLYDEFWADPAIGRARILIIYDSEYEQLPKILSRRLNSTDVSERPYQPEDMENLEFIDRFCAKATQITFVRGTKFPFRRKDDFKQIFLAYWGNKIEQRKELKQYIINFAVYPLDVRIAYKLGFGYGFVCRYRNYARDDRGGRFGFREVSRRFV